MVRPTIYPPHRQATAPPLDVPDCLPAIRRRLAAAQPWMSAALMHLAAGRPDLAHAAIDAAASQIAEWELGWEGDRRAAPLSELTLPHYGVNQRTLEIVERAVGGSLTVGELVRGAADIRSISEIGPRAYADLMTAAARFLSGE